MFRADRCAMKRKMAVIVAAEVDDYIGLLSGLTGQGLVEFSNQRSTIAKSAAGHGGRVFSASGGSSMLEFASAVEAVRWASSIIERSNGSLGEASSMAFRFGVMIGDVVHSEGDLLGDGVNIASRLAGVAEPGTICVARIVYEQIRNKVPMNATDLGPKSLKNLPDPIHAFVLRHPLSGQASDFMPPVQNATPAPIADRQTSFGQWTVMAVSAAGLTLAITWSLWSLLAVIATQTPETKSRPLAPAELSAATSTPVTLPPSILGTTSAVRDVTGPAAPAAGINKPFGKPSVNQCRDILERVQSGLATLEDRRVLEQLCK